MDENIKKEDEIKNETWEFFIEPKGETEVTKEIKKEPDNSTYLDSLDFKSEKKVEEIVNIPQNNQVETKDTSVTTPSKDPNSLESLLQNVWETFPKQKKEKFSININSFDDILKIVLNNEYDYVVISPEYEKVKITFKKDERDVDEKFINYPVYSNILVKLKPLVNFDTDKKKAQELKWRYKFDKKEYDLEVFTIPESFWEKITIKAAMRVKNKASINDILTFTWALSFIIFILSSAFITFIVMNAQNVEDVIFFNSLWISLNDINDFIWKVVNLVFSSVIFIGIILFAIFWIKYIITKKEFKKKRLIYWSLATLFLVLTFLSWNLWIATIRKVKSLPNWQEMSYWEIQLYDNTKLLLDKIYAKKDALITEADYGNLIWPVTIKFDLTYYAKKEEKSWYQIEKFTWDFWDWEIREELTPIVIKEFNEKRTYNIKVTIDLKQLDWKTTTKEIDNIPLIWIRNLVKIKEDVTNSWWKKVTLDATDLRTLWKVEWYLENDLKTPILVWERFTHPKVIFSDTIIWLYIRKEWKLSTSLDKVFLIGWTKETEINWTIQEKMLDNDLTYEFSLKDVKNWLDDWFIEQYRWIIWDTEKILKNEIWKEEESSKIKHMFVDYWAKEIKVILTDTYWKTREIKKIINITKQTVIKNSISVYDNGELISPRHENWVYYVQDLPIPTTLRFDARLLKTENPLDSLQKVVWEIDSKTKIWTVFDYKIESEWKVVINVTYTFKSIKDSSEKVMKEIIYINSIKKEALLDLEIKPSEEEYVPVTIQFDASKSEIKDENITKFIYDYWDWTEPEERDAVNRWHKYTVPWDYTITLTAITATWKEYSITKKLILKPRPQLAQIKVSMKEAPVNQWIDFLSSDSEWQIVSYFWDFWDGETSTDANPTHSYREAWTYKVRLKIEFTNKNILEDIIVITVTN